MAIPSGGPHRVAFLIPADGAPFLSGWLQLKAAAHTAVGALAADAAGAFGHAGIGKKINNPGLQPRVLKVPMTATG